MKTEEEVEDFILNGHKHYLRHITIDCAIIGYHDQQLILLVKWKHLNGWGLPGGFIMNEETLNEAANRILMEKTSLSDLFLQQFYTFGDSFFRLSKKDWDKDQRLLIPIPEDNWLLERTISIGYYAVVDFEKVSISPDIFYDEYQWCDIQSIPELLFDHNEMVEKAIQTIRLQIYHQPIGYNLLSEKFTLPEIHVLYETILGKQLDRRNFPKKLMSLGILKKLDEQRSIGPHRSPFLYEFDKENYEKALMEGIALAF
ncbi:NUDIX domain-containing protein [Pseudarcicella hirudinis]|uniref:NUDIX hydrolase n=1 Tax=Pseudarcicella hirudinis TaxID=1079859 RepID=UPI0035EF3B66